MASWPSTPTRWSRCLRCSTTGCRPGADVGFLGAAQMRPLREHQHDGQSLRQPEGAFPAPAGRRIAGSAREVVVVLRQTPRAFVEELSFVTSVGHRHGGDSARNSATAARSHRDHHRPRHPEARPRDQGIHARLAASRGHRRAGEGGDGLGSEGVASSPIPPSRPPSRSSRSCATCRRGPRPREEGQDRKFGPGIARAE